MKIVIFGLTISSSWGNGHATLWRGLCKHLIRAGHRIVFFERDVPYYAGARDLTEIPGGRLVLFSSWEEIRAKAADELRDADVTMVSSYCPDAILASELAFTHGGSLSVFYDLDTPVTLAKVRAGENVDYIGDNGLASFRLVLSYTGGQPLFDEYRRRLGAGEIHPLYGHVDADVHHPVPPQQHYRAALSYLGTYSADRQPALEALLVGPARQRPDCRFLLGGAQYPVDFPWSPNIYFVRHLPPSEHAPFFASSRLTLNVTRPAMAEMGWCPSGRLFEAAACGAPLLSDGWRGIDDFFEPGEEIILAADADDSLAAIDLGDHELRRMATRARERTLDQHGSDRRASELIGLLERAMHSTSRNPAPLEA